MDFQICHKIYVFIIKYKFSLQTNFIIIISYLVSQMCQFLCCECWWCNMCGVCCAGWHAAWCLASCWMCKDDDLAAINSECCICCRCTGWGHNCFCWGNVCCAP